MFKIKKSEIILIGTFLAIVMSLTFILTYNLMRKSVKNIIVSNVDELTQHDMQSIQGYVSERIEAVQTVVDEIKYEDSKNVDDILEMLRIKVETSSFTKLGLIADDGTLYTTPGDVVPADKNTFLEYFDGSCGKHFARRYDGMEHDDELVLKYLIYGIDYSDAPIVVADKRFVGAVALNYISEIQDKMRISLFGGKGYSSVINREGFYIVAPDSNTNPKELPNFFDMIENRKFSEGYDIETVRKKVMNRETFTFSTVDSKGMERFISIKPIKDSNWCFINSIDTYVFKEHTNPFIKITLFVIVFLMIILLGCFWVFYFVRNRLEKLYTTSVDGVFNRKYYNEKLKTKNVKSFIMLNLDHLKYINDGSGHLAGDLAIASAAEIIRNRIGSFGEVVRYGGDEFAVVYNSKVTEDEFLDQINGIISDIHNKKLDKFPEISLSLSIGGYYGEGISDELLALADELLYDAKKSRDCAVTNIDKTGDDSTNE